MDNRFNKPPNNYSRKSKPFKFKCVPIWTVWVFFGNQYFIFLVMPIQFSPQLFLQKNFYFTFQTLCLDFKKNAKYVIGNTSQWISKVILQQRNLRSHQLLICLPMWRFCDLVFFKSFTSQLSYPDYYPFKPQSLFPNTVHANKKLAWGQAAFGFLDAHGSFVGNFLGY